MHAVAETDQRTPAVNAGIRTINSVADGVINRLPRREHLALVNSNQLHQLSRDPTGFPVK